MIIVEFENAGAERAELYGKKLLATLADELTANFGRGFSKRSLEQFRNFYMSYREIAQTLSAQFPIEFKKIGSALSDQSQDAKKNLGVLLVGQLSIEKIAQTLSTQFSLSWSHYVVLQTIKFDEERQFYEIEALENSWSIREFKRQVAASLYERLAVSRDKIKLKELSQKGQLIERPSDVLKDPYILEFLDLPEHSHYSENDLETAIIDKIENFLLELGKGFLFEARQKRFTFEEDHFYVDLVFYNHLLRSYVLIDLKRDKLTHQDLGQMQMYVNYFDRCVKREHEAPTIGIVLCHRKNDALVELTLPKGSNIHASEYQLYLPSKEELRKQVVEAERTLEDKGENCKDKDNS
jgi:predicted nuclease of restriction endonuclease-like (RecB) superfamily